MKNVTYKVIGRGQASWHADAGMVEHGAISGGGEYTTRESSKGGTLEGYVAQAVDGCFVYDADEADADAFINHVFKDPLVDVDLPAGCMRKALSNEHIIAEPEVLSIDHVALDIFEATLRRVPGMKFGRVVGGKVVWE
jgi:hypothetical protein